MDRNLVTFLVNQPFSNNRLGAPEPPMLQAGREGRVEVPVGGRDPNHQPHHTPPPEGQRGSDKEAEHSGSEGRSSEGRRDNSSSGGSRDNSGEDSPPVLYPYHTEGKVGQHVLPVGILR